VRTNLFDKLDVIIMANSTQVIDSTRGNIAFDLKGSTVNRKTKLSSKDWDRIKSHQICGKILKDNNMIEINKELDNSLLNLDHN